MSERRRLQTHDFERRRLARLAAASAVSCVAMLVMSLDRRALVRARAREHDAIVAAASLVGPELALHAGARWLRHPTRVEPWAYGHDGPGLADADPAGAFASPARESLAAGGSIATRARVIRRSGAVTREDRR